MLDDLARDDVLRRLAGDGKKGYFLALADAEGAEAVKKIFAPDIPRVARNAAGTGQWSWHRLPDGAIEPHIRRPRRKPWMERAGRQAQHPHPAHSADDTRRHDQCSLIRPEALGNALGGGYGVQSVGVVLDPANRGREPANLSPGLTWRASGGPAAAQAT